MAEQGHAVRITTRGEAGRAAIEACGAECWIGTPDRLATLRAALEGVTILCWLLGSAAGPAAEVEALHGTRLEFFLTQAIDTTVRGFVYEPAGAPIPSQVRAQGEEIVRRLAALNAIPVALLTVQRGVGDAWLREARGAIEALLVSA